jgi:hypothetical protein
MSTATNSKTDTLQDQSRYRSRSVREDSFVLYEAFGKEQFGGIHHCPYNGQLIRAALVMT